MKYKLLTTMTLAAGMVFGVAPNANAFPLNSTSTSDSCEPPTLNCITIVVGPTDPEKGKKYYTTSYRVRGMSDAELLRRFRSEFVVLTDIRGSSIGF